MSSTPLLDALRKKAAGDSLKLDALLEAELSTRREVLAGAEALLVRVRSFNVYWHRRF